MRRARKSISPTPRRSSAFATRWISCCSEAERLRAIYPRINIVPLLYRVEDDLLYQLKES